MDYYSPDKFERLNSSLNETEFSIQIMYLEGDEIFHFELIIA